MKKVIKMLSVSLFTALILISCSTDENNNVVPIDSSMVANLIFPENNIECNEGQIISDTQNNVLFKWEEAINASSYILSITNLNNNTTRKFQTDSNELLVRLLRGTPYSWSVKSIVIGTNELAESDIWKFYNAGLPQKSHPPIPAEAVTPQNGASINEEDITLQWEVTDVDDDIASYTVLLDTFNPPVVEAGTSNIKSLNITVNQNEVYYWKVKTTDVAGNTSESQTFQFKVN